MKAKGLTKETILNVDVAQRGFPDFKIGDTVEVSQVIKEGDKERIQLFEGDVIKRRNNGIATTFTVRRISAGGIGVERIFPLYSLTVNKIRLVKQGIVRRAKLYYLRSRTGRAARVKEKSFQGQQRHVSASAAE